VEVVSKKGGLARQKDRFAPELQTILRPEAKSMVNKLRLPPPGFEDLSIEDQIDYVQSLWARIAARPDQVPVPEWHRRVLDERIAAHEADPRPGRPWDEVRDEIRLKLGHRKPER
jgi:putative addiction module component (TIGR02574 family)